VAQWAPSVVTASESVSTFRRPRGRSAAELVEEQAGHPDVRSEYLTPIRFRGRILGVLNLESPHQDAFDEESRGVFDAIAAQVAGAVLGILLLRIVAERRASA